MNSLFESKAFVNNCSIYSQPEPRPTFKVQVQQFITLDEQENCHSDLEFTAIMMKADMVNETKSDVFFNADFMFFRGYESQPQEAIAFY